MNKAVEKINLAVDADHKKDYKTAYEHYMRALEYFEQAVKFEPLPQMKEKLKAMMLSYMNRIEMLKKYLDESEKAAQGPPQGGGAGTAEKKQGEGDADAEKDKMRGALSSAIVAEKPNVKWTDVAGLEGAKEALKEAVILPVKFPQLFTGKRKPWKGILLYGPPGTGKSYLAKAVATEADSTFFSISSSDLVSKWQGESEKMVKNLFQMARESSPAIVFIDEIDSLCTNRSEGESESARRIKTEFLVQMDGVGSNQTGVLVLGATNVPWEIDPAMRRRFEKRVYIPLPEKSARSFMFKLNIGSTPNSLTDDDYKFLGERSEGYSGSDVAVVVREALMEPLRKCQKAKQFLFMEGKYHPCIDYPNCHMCPMQLSETPPTVFNEKCPHCWAERKTLYEVDSELLAVPDIDQADVVKAINRTTGSVGKDELTKFEEWTSEFGQEGV